MGLSDQGILGGGGEGKGELAINRDGSFLGEEEREKRKICLSKSHIGSFTLSFVLFQYFMAFTDIASFSSFQRLHTHMIKVAISQEKNSLFPLYFQKKNLGKGKNVEIIAKQCKAIKQ